MIFAFTKLLNAPTLIDYRVDFLQFFKLLILGSAEIDTPTKEVEILKAKKYRSSSHLSFWLVEGNGELLCPGGKGRTSDRTESTWNHSRAPKVGF